MHNITLIVAFISAILGLIIVIKNFVVAIYDLENTPGLNTFDKCVQVVKNFFTIK